MRFLLFLLTYFFAGEKKGPHFQVNRAGGLHLRDNAWIVLNLFGNGSRVGDDLIAVPHIQCDLVRIGITTGGFNFGDILANRLGKLGHYFDYLWQLFLVKPVKMG